MTEETQIAKVDSEHQHLQTAQQGSEPSPALILQRAVDSGASPEAVEKLVELYERLEARQAKKAFNEAMSAFQEECPVIEKQKEVRNSKKKGGSLRYKYAPLDDIVKQVREPLRKCGLSYTIDTAVEEGWVTSKCKVIHVLGHSETTEFKVPIDRDAYMNDQQKYASAQTFSKRYAFCNSLGILTGDEDDDGRGAGNPEPPRNQRQQVNDPPPPGISQEPQPVTDKQVKLFNTLGNFLYDAAWDSKRPEIIKAYTSLKRDGDPVEHTKDLTKHEMSTLLDKLRRKEELFREMKVQLVDGEPDAEGYTPDSEVSYDNRVYQISVKDNNIKCDCPEAQAYVEKEGEAYAGNEPVDWCIHVRKAVRWSLENA